MPDQPEKSLVLSHHDEASGLWLEVGRFLPDQLLVITDTRAFPRVPYLLGGDAKGRGRVRTVPEDLGKLDGPREWRLERIAGRGRELVHQAVLVMSFDPKGGFFRLAPPEDE